MVGRAEQHRVAIRGELPAAGKRAHGGFGFANDRLGDFLGHDVAAEDTSERIPHKTLQPALEAIRAAHSVPLRPLGVFLLPTIVSVLGKRVSYPLVRGSVGRGRSLVVLGTPAAGVPNPVLTFPPRPGEWRNGRRARFRSVCP